MRALVLAAAMAAGAAQAAPAASDAATIGTLMQRYAAMGQLDGTVLVADHGKVVYQHAFGLANREWKVPNTVDTSFKIASLTKQFTAMLVMQLVDQGKLKLDDTVGQYVPGLRADIGAKVTIAQLLNHSSGIVDYANFPGFWANRLGEKVPQADLLAIMNHDLEFAPGTTGHYNSSGYTLLGWIIEQRTGKPYPQVLDEQILQPLKMSRTSFDDSDKVIDRRANGYVRALGKYHVAPPVWMPNLFAGGAMTSTVGDFLKWDRALYGKQLLSDEGKRKMFAPGLKDDVWGDLAFGYGWLTGTRTIAGKERLVHEHGGNANGFRTLITRYPDEQRLVVILLNEGNGNKGPAIYGIRTAITKVLYKVPVAMPREPLADAIVASIDKAGVEATVAKFAQLQQGRAAVASADELNMLGYQYAGEKRYDAALAVMGLNLKLYPDDANSYDTIGEIQLMKGDQAAAIASYRRSLELDPKNSNAADVLRKLGAAAPVK